MKTICIILFVLFLTIGSFAQSRSVIDCSIWKPSSFCDIPDSRVTIPRKIKMDSTSVRYITCENLDKMGNMTGVWLTLTKKDGSTLKFESNFKNINLVKKSDGKTIHPFAILWSSSYDNNGKKILQYLTSDFKTTKFEAKFSFQKKIDLVLIFTGAENGDKIIIDNFVEATIRYITVANTMQY